ncbi:MAG: GTPase domain-containing protein [Hyphomicrobiaceae bacterium]|nr:GTPase domain-containing protein [Hyphomicrobiaceae bacterium]
MTNFAVTHNAISDQARRLAPVVWLIGKVQSGKTSIIRTLTGAGDAEIGAGFRACTKTARIFDFPQEAPIIRFLDTRGLGEVAYDPATDIAYSEDRAHLMLVVVKAMDSEQGAVVETVRAARQRHPDWPVAVAQTTLHEGYAPGHRHAQPYPFTGEDADGAAPEPLGRALVHQRSLFAALRGKGPLCFVPVDFTQPEDGLDPPDYGREALIAALVAVAPAAVRLAVQELPGAADGEALTRAANAHILGFAAAAGASDALPVAGVVTVPVLQAAMLRQLAKLYDIGWDRRSYAEFLAALGTGTLLRTASTFGVRQLVKLVPVYGQTVGAATAAAASFAATYAIGKAASYYLVQRRRGVAADDVATVYRQALRNAFRMAQQRDPQGGSPR